MRGVGAFLVIATLLLTIYLATMSPPMPRCQEDAVIVGVGDFEAGRWSSYECGPARDDFLP